MTEKKHAIKPYPLGAHVEDVSGLNSVQSETFLAAQGVSSKVNRRNVNTLTSGRGNILLAH